MTETPHTESEERYAFGLERKTHLSQQHGRVLCAANAALVGRGKRARGFWGASAHRPGACAPSPPDLETCRSLGPFAR